MELKKLDYALTICKVASECDIDFHKDFYFIGVHYGRYTCKYAGTG